MLFHLQLTKSDPKNVDISEDKKKVAIAFALNVNFTKSMAKEAIDCVTDALQTNTNYWDVENCIKQAFDSKFEPDWKCLIIYVKTDCYCALDQSQPGPLSIINFTFGNDVRITVYKKYRHVSKENSTDANEMVKKICWTLLCAVIFIVIFNGFYCINQQSIIKTTNNLMKVSFMFISRI